MVKKNSTFKFLSYPFFTDTLICSCNSLRDLELPNKYELTS